MSISTTNHDWLLPDGVADILFVDAQKQESLRDALLFVLTAHGFRLVSPPLIEYTQTLFAQTDEDLRRQTFKIIDQLNGRTMGVRADITPQITRIDAQHGHKISRYCYVGQVVKTLPTGLFGLRTPMQLGAEIFGVEDVLDAASELSLIDLIASLFAEIAISGEDLHIDIGHVAIFKRLCQIHAMDVADINQLMLLYNKKSLPELTDFCQNLTGGVDFLTLVTHIFDGTSLPSADNLLNKLSDVAKNDQQIQKACYEIQTLARHAKKKGMTVSVDVAELSGYHYHTGLVFNIYLNTQTSQNIQTQALVSGGRFCASDTRQATGFSMDINRLLDFVELQEDTVIWVDFADMQDKTQACIQDLDQQIKNLQDEGCIVIKPLSKEDKPDLIDGVLYFDKEQKQWLVSLLGDD